MLQSTGNREDSEPAPLRDAHVVAHILSSRQRSEQARVGVEYPQRLGDPSSTDAEVRCEVGPAVDTRNRADHRLPATRPRQHALAARRSLLLDYWGLYDLQLTGKTESNSTPGCSRVVEFGEPLKALEFPRLFLFFRSATRPPGRCWSASGLAADTMDRVRSGVVWA